MLYVIVKVIKPPIKHPSKNDMIPVWCFFNSLNTDWLSVAGTSLHCDLLKSVSKAFSASSFNILSEGTNNSEKKLNTQSFSDRQYNCQEPNLILKTILIWNFASQDNVAKLY